MVGTGRAGDGWVRYGLAWFLFEGEQAMTDAIGMYMKDDRRPQVDIAGGDRRCASCRYWSATLSRAVGSRAVQAVCLAPDGPHFETWCFPTQWCPSWAPGEPVDTPTFEAIVFPG